MIDCSDDMVYVFGANDRPARLFTREESIRLYAGPSEIHKEMRGLIEMGLLFHLRR